MLIERDGSDTPPSRFVYSAGSRAQLSRFDKSRATKNSCGAVWRNGPLLPVFSSKRRRSLFMPRLHPRTCGEIRTAYAAKAAKQSLFNRN